MTKTMKRRGKRGKRNNTRKNQHRHGQRGGGFSFTSVLASVILSVASMFGLKQAGFEI